MNFRVREYRYVGVELYQLLDLKYVMDGKYILILRFMNGIFEIKLKYSSHRSVRVGILTLYFSPHLLGIS